MVFISKMLLIIILVNNMVPGGTCEKIIMKSRYRELLKGNFIHVIFNFVMYVKIKIIFWS
jgi:hypothetical protein